MQTLVDAVPSREIRDAVIESGMERDVSQSEDKLVEYRAPIALTPRDVPVGKSHTTEPRALAFVSDGLSYDEP